MVGEAKHSSLRSKVFIRGASRSSCRRTTPSTTWGPIEIPLCSASTSLKRPRRPAEEEARDRMLLPFPSHKARVTSPPPHSWSPTCSSTLWTNNCRSLRLPKGGHRRRRGGAAHHPAECVPCVDRRRLSSSSSPPPAAASPCNCNCHAGRPLPSNHHSAKDHLRPRRQDGRSEPPLRTLQDITSTPTCMGWKVPKSGPALRSSGSVGAVQGGRPECWLQGRDVLEVVRLPRLSQISTLFHPIPAQRTMGMICGGGEAANAGAAPYSRLAAAVVSKRWRTTTQCTWMHAIQGASCVGASAWPQRPPVGKGARSRIDRQRRRQQQQQTKSLP